MTIIISIFVDIDLISDMLHRYILGVPKHTTDLDQQGGSDETLKCVLAHKLGFVMYIACLQGSEGDPECIFPLNIY